MPEGETQETPPMALPNLAGVATADLVENIQAGNFSAPYINWSRTMQLLRENAPGWMPELLPSASGFVHEVAGGGFLMIFFRHMGTGQKTPPVPQAIMDNRNNSVPIGKINSRHVSDTHRRGLCMAAALTFGLAYELAAKMPMETGYADNKPVAAPARQAAQAGPQKSASRAPVRQQSQPAKVEKRKNPEPFKPMDPAKVQLIKNLAHEAGVTDEQILSEFPGSTIDNIHADFSDEIIGRLNSKLN